jgi:predicted RNA-binding protein
MKAPTYWLNLFTGETWQELIDAGVAVSGFRKIHWTSVQKIKPGDILLCYMIGVSRWVGLLQVISEPFLDASPIWKSDPFLARVRVRAEVTLTPEIGIPVLLMRDQLSVFRNLKNQRHWAGAFRKAPLRWKAQDGEIVVAALREAARHPVLRPIDSAKLPSR